MKYSKKIIIALLGSSVFSKDQVDSYREEFNIELKKDLDVFSTLLFFFLFEENFRPNKFIQFFSGIQKISDLKKNKDIFRNTLDTAFDDLSRIQVHGKPFLTYERCKNQYKFELSSEAVKLESNFLCQLESKDFLPDIRRGVSTSYLCAYLYLTGICNLGKIDLSYLQSQFLFKTFDTSRSVLSMKKKLKIIIKDFKKRNILSKKTDQLKDYHFTHKNKIIKNEKIKNSERKNLTYNGKSCSIIELDLPLLTYINLKLIRKKQQYIQSNSIDSQIPPKMKRLMYEIALNSMMQYSNQKQVHQYFRTKFFQYFHKGITKREINSFFYHLTDRILQLPKRNKAYISNSGYRKTIQNMLLTAILSLPVNLPVMISQNALIVPVGYESQVIGAISNSFHSYTKQKRSLIFKVTNSSVKRFIFTRNAKLKEVKF